MSAQLDLDAVIGFYGGTDEALIPMLQDIQAHYNYLPGAQLQELADRLEIPVTRVYSVATFYKAFSLVPRGKHVFHVCMGTACHVRGAKRIADALERKMGVKAGNTTEDMLFTLETVNCVGSCALGPLVVVGDKYYGKTTSKAMENIVDDLQTQAGKGGE